MLQEFVPWLDQIVIIKQWKSPRVTWGTVSECNVVEGMFARQNILSFFKVKIITILSCFSMSSSRPRTTSFVDSQKSAANSFSSGMKTSSKDGSKVSSVWSNNFDSNNYCDDPGDDGDCQSWAGSWQEHRGLLHRHQGETILKTLTLKKLKFIYNSALFLFSTFYFQVCFSGCGMQH